MKNFTLNVFAVIILFCFGAQAQNNKTQKKSDKNLITRCSSDDYNAELLKTNPNMMGSKAFEQFLKPKIKEATDNSSDNNRQMVVVTIPVVIHVLHNGEPIGTGPNISDAQVLSQITVLNEDFRRLAGTPGGANTSGAAVDVEVEFCLAQRTPDGCPTNGINRVNICQDGTDSSDVAYWKGQTNWDPSSYMNMWSSKYVGDLNGILGFAQFPGGPAATDGVSAGHTFFGSSDYDDGTFDLSAPYDKGRTMTHEVGHYLGLYHTFQGGCAAPGDEVNDTPAVAAPNYGCTPNTSCGSADMIQNYMDYTDDTCMDTFTAGQKARVVSVLNTSRSGLGSSNGCTPPAPVNYDGSPKIETLNIETCGPQFTPDITIYNYGTVTMTSAVITYDVDGAGAQTYNWSGSLNEGESETFTLPTVTSTAGNHDFNVTISNPNNTSDLRSCNDTDTICVNLNAAPVSVDANTIELTLVTDDYGSETTWEFTDSSGTVLYSGGPYANNTTYTESFVITNDCYNFTINDSFGDGICCAYGNGSYELRTDIAAGGTLVASGGDFTNSESTIMNINFLSVNEISLEDAISIYPNPTTDVLNIKATNNNLPESYKVYNMLGQLVASKTILNESDLAVSTSNYSNGMYFIKIEKEGNVLSLPFIKK